MAGVVLHAHCEQQKCLAAYADLGHCPKTDESTAHVTVTHVYKYD